jgi:hypothetical protein
MRHKFVFLLLVLSPMFAFSQTSPEADSANKLILNGQDCTDRTYTKVQTLPALKISTEEYADTLGSYLKSNKAFPKNTTVEFKFIVTCHGEIHSLHCHPSDVGKKEILEKAILQYSSLWLPARQNGYIVNSYVTLTLAFDKNTLGIEISQ